jgi:hypothetical protein
MAHSNERREFALTDDGLTLRDTGDAAHSAKGRDGHAVV